MTDERLLLLIGALLESRLTPEESGELTAELRLSARARRLYWEVLEQHALVGELLSETRGRDLALLEEGAPDAPPTVTRPPAARPDKRRAWAWAGLAVAVAAGLVLALGGRPEHVGELKPAPADESAALGTVESLAGHVQLTETAGVADVTTPGRPIFDGQTVRVGDDVSRAEVRLSDGTRLTLHASSVLRFAVLPAGAGTTLHLEQGAVQVQSSPRPNGPPLVVTTDHTRITAPESRFRVYLEDRASLVEVESGTVRLARPSGGDPVDLHEGSYVVATTGARPMVPEPLAGDQYRLRCTLAKAGDAVALSRDGTRLATGHRERGLRVWDTRDGSLRDSATGHGQLTSGLAFAPAGDAAVALGSGGTAAVWKFAEPRASQTRLHEKELRDSAVSENGRWLAQALRSGEVAVWELDPDTGNSSLKQTLPIKPSRVALAATGSHVAVSQWGGEIRVFDVQSGRVTAEHKLKRTPTPLAVSADGRYVAAFAVTEGLVVFDGVDDTRRTFWTGDSSRANHLAFTSNGAVLLAGFEDGVVRGWSTESGSARLVLDTGHRHVNRVTATADLSLLATVGDGDCVKLWERKPR